MMRMMKKKIMMIVKKKMIMMKVKRVTTMKIESIKMSTENTKTITESMPTMQSMSMEILKMKSLKMRVVLCIKSLAGLYRPRLHHNFIPCVTTYGVGVQKMLSLALVMPITTAPLL